MSYNIIADMNVHTVADAGAFSTVKECMDIAAQRHLQCVAITEHVYGIKGAPEKRYFEECIRHAPRRINGVDIIYGIEMHLLGLNGIVLDNDTEDIVKTDWTIFGYNPQYTCRNITPTRQIMTDTYKKTLYNPYLMVLSHAGKYGCEFDYADIVAAYKDGGRLIEINNNDIKYSNALEKKSIYQILKVCKDIGEPIVVSSGARYCEEVGDFASAKELLESLQFPEHLIINTDYDKLKEYIRLFKEWQRSEEERRKYGGYKNQFSVKQNTSNTEREKEGNRR